MKKFLSVLLVVIMIFTVSVIAASAFDSAETAVEVKSGDTVIYTLNASEVAEPVICADFSIYYDSSIFTCESFSDQPSGSVVNKDLDGEVRGNWVNLDGVDYSSTAPVITVTLKAKADGSSNISYYMRDFCYDEDNDIVEVTSYKFTATVKINSTTVIDNQPAELNVDEDQDIGGFSNSASGSSKDAGIIISKGVTNVDHGVAAEKANNNVNGDEVNENNVQATTNKKSDDSDKKTDDTKSESADSKDKSTGSTVNDSADSNKSTNDVAVTTEQNNSGGPSAWLWIIIGLVVLGGGGAAGYFIYKNKKASSATDAATTNFSNNNNNYNNNNNNNTPEI